MKFLWALALLFFCDLAMPSAPGAFQPLEGQSLEITRRLPVQAATAVIPPPSLQPSVATQPRLSMRVPRREVTSHRSVVVPVVRSQVEAEAPAVDDPDLA